MTARVSVRDASRSRLRLLRRVTLGAVVLVLAVEAHLVSDQLAQAWHSLRAAGPGWVLAAAIAAMLSMHSFAQIQRELLKSAGVTVRQWRSEAAFYAGNALSTTLPGGPVLSATFIYRQQRRWGASPLVASWQLVMSGALQVVGLAVIGLAGALAFGAGADPRALVLAVGGFIAALGLVQAVASRPGMLEGIGIRVLGWCNRLRNRPVGAGRESWRGILHQLEAVKLGRGELGIAFGWSLFNWIADVACLLFAAYAAGGHPSLAGVTVAYAAARAVGTIPLMPGGLLVVEAVLVPGLVSAGMTLPTAISAMLIYRAVSWVFISVIGWGVFFFNFRGEGQVGSARAEPGRAWIGA